jgi:hypothetical protein
MKRAVLPTALLLASGMAQAHVDKDGNHVNCDISSRYSVVPYRSAFLFAREDGKPGEIGLGGGRLFIDGKEQTLSPADHERLTRFESELHELVPQMQQVAVQATDIAFTALIEVARGLASDPKSAISSLEQAHQRVRREIDSKPLIVFNDDAIKGVVEPIVTKFVPEIAGGAVTMALKAAFGGEQASKDFQARMDRMEHELDTRVDAQAKSLEPLAEAMCQRLRRMDGLDDTLEFRLPDGEALELLRVDQPDRTDAP